MPNYYMSSETQYKCEDCGMSFNCQQELQQHANKERVGQLECIQLTIFIPFFVDRYLRKICYGKMLCGTTDNQIYN